MRALAPLLISLVAQGAACASPAPSSRAALLTSTGRPGEAVEMLEARLRAEPSDVIARSQLIRVLGYRGDLSAAEEQAARLAGQLGPEEPTPWIELGHAYELAHRYEEALSFYDRAAEVAPEDPRGPRAGGTRAARWGEVDWAAPRLEEALRRQPRDGDTWHVLGLVRIHQGKYEEARRAYERGLLVSPEQASLRIGLATLALRMNQPEKALEQYDALAARRPTDGDVQLGRAYVLFRLSREAEARAALERAQRLGASATVVAQLTRALDHQRVGDLPTSGAAAPQPPPAVR